MNRLEESVGAWPVNTLPATLSLRTRRVYDRLAAVYPLSTMCFHSRAHRCAVEVSGLRDGMRVLELLSADDIVSTLHEFRRILRNRGKLTLVLIGQNTAVFNGFYKVLGKIAPAFWGRQVEQRVPQLIGSMRFEILHDRQVRQGFYPSRVLVARK